MKNLKIIYKIMKHKIKIIQKSNKFKHNNNNFNSNNQYKKKIKENLAIFHKINNKILSIQINLNIQGFNN